MPDPDVHPRVQINLLGEFVLRTGATSTSQPWSMRVQALVAYLLLHRATPQARTQIAFVFWPDTTSQQAYTNLRQLLHHLRRVWPDADQFLHITPKTIQWRTSASFTLDVADFEAHLARTAQSAQASVSGERRASLAAAIDLYRGDLFPTCYEEWILPRREQLRTAFGHALEELILLLESQGDYPAAIAYAQRLVQHDPLHEGAYRHLMRLHAANHDRAAALRVYHVCATLLERELDAPPHPATQALYQQLLQENVTANAPAPLPPVQPGQARLVGRQTEWRQLQRIWQEVVQGRTHCVLIAGEAGIGKTRLAEELAHWVSQQGVAVLSARAYAAEGALAYAPVYEWCSSPVIRGGLARLADHWLLEIARLLPEVLTIRPHLQQPDAGRIAQDGSGQRIRLFEALARGVLGSAQPLLLLLDDLQWCDGETLEWLHYFLRFDAQARCLLLVTVRPEDVEPDHPLHQFLASVRTLDRFDAFDLKPLTAGEAALLANQTAGHPLDAQTVEQLYQISSGNPLFVVESARAIIRSDEGAVESAPTRPAPSATDLDSVALPPKIQSLLQQRLTQLSSAARELVEVAAVFGRSFTVDLLLAMTQQTEDALVQAMDELWRRRLVREQGVSAYDFSHDYIREVAYATLSPARRRLLHRRVAEGLERFYGVSLDSISGQLGLHLERAGLPAAAIRRYRQAGIHARRLFAYQEAIFYLTRAIELQQRLPDDPSGAQQEMELQLILGPVLMAARGEGAAATEAAYRRAYEIGQKYAEPAQLWAILRGLSVVYHHRGDIRAGHQLAQHALQLAQQMQKPAHLVRAYIDLGAALVLLGDVADARLALEEGLALYARHQRDAQPLFDAEDDPNITGHFFQAICLLWLGYPEQALQHILRGREMAQQGGNPFLVAFSHYHFAYLHAFCRQWQLARREAAALLEFGKTYNFPIYLPVGLALTGRASVEAGQIDAGIAQMQEAIAATQPTLINQTWFLTLLAEVYARRGEIGSGLALVEEALAIVEKSGMALLAVEILRVKGELLAAVAHKEAEDTLQQALDLARQKKVLFFELRTAVSLARLWQKEGRRDAAQTLLAECYGKFSEGFDLPDLQVARRLLEDLTQLERS